MVGTGCTVGTGGKIGLKGTATVARTGGSEPEVLVARVAVAEPEGWVASLPGAVAKPTVAADN